MSKLSFRELGVSESVVAVLAGNSIDHPFRIQELVLPDALAGLDVELRTWPLPASHLIRTAWSMAGHPAAERFLGTFDVLLLFNYLDRARMSSLTDFLRPGGLFMMETFLEDQKAFDWGPTSDDHLLKRGELANLLPAFDVLHGREALEPVEGVHWSAVAAILARKKVA